MKNVFPAIFLACLFCLTACGDALWNGSDFATKEGHAKNLSKMKEAMEGDDPELYSISFVGEAATDSELVFVNMFGYAPGTVEEEINYSYYPGTGNADRENYTKDTRELMVMSFNKGKPGKPQTKFSQINFDNMIPYLNKAIEMIPPELNFRSVYSIDIDLNPDPAKYKYNFTIHATPKVGATEFQGRSMVTSYYDLEFKSDGAGNVNLEE